MSRIEKELPSSPTSFLRVRTTTVPEDRLASHPRGSRSECGSIHTILSEAVSYRTGRSTCYSNRPMGRDQDSDACESAPAAQRQYRLASNR